MTPFKLCGTWALLAIAVFASGLFEREAEAARSRKIEIPVLASTPLPSSGSLTRIRYWVSGESISFEREIELSVGYLGIQVKAAEQEPFLGLLVERIENDSPAQIGGLMVRDRLLSIGEEPVSTERRFRYLVQTHDLSKPLVLHLDRQGRKLEIIVPLATFKIREQAIEVQRLRTYRDGRHTGASFGEVEGVVARYFYPQEEKGVMIAQIAPGSPFFYSDLRAGDLIVTLNDQPVSDPNAAIRFFEQAARSDDTVRVTVRRGRATLSQEVEPATRIGDGFDFDLFVISWEKRPAETEFELVWGLVFDYEWKATYDRSGEPRVYRGWSFPLNLIEYENNGGKKKFGLLWIFNFRW